MAIVTALSMRAVFSSVVLTRLHHDVTARIIQYRHTSSRAMQPFGISDGFLGIACCMSLNEVRDHYILHTVT